MGLGILHEESEYLLAVGTPELLVLPPMDCTIGNSSLQKRLPVLAHDAYYIYRHHERFYEKVGKVAGPVGRPDPRHKR